MSHNIKLAHGAVPGPDEDTRVRYIPPPGADSYSVRGMIHRLTEDASPGEVASILEEVTSALAGVLPELIGLTAAAADWTRLRLSFDNPVPPNAPFETWTRLAAAHNMLEGAQEYLLDAEAGVAACPQERTHPRHHEMVYELRTRELLHDVMGAPAPHAAPSTADTRTETKRQQAAQSTSPNVVARGTPTQHETAEAPPSAASHRPPHTR
nr:hypothetical protein [Streptomyces sp. SID11385]